MQKHRYYRKTQRSGFTILESVIAILLLSIAATMVFSVTYPAVNQAYQNRNQAVARQYSQLLLNEMLQLPVQTTAPTTGVVNAGSPFQDRSQFASIRQFNGYASHACFPDGTSYTTMYNDSEIATIESICYRIVIEDVDSNFSTGGGAEFVRITISAFLDPDQNLQPDGRSDLYSLVHLIGQGS